MSYKLVVLWLVILAEENAIPDTWQKCVLCTQFCRVWSIN